MSTRINKANYQQGLDCRYNMHEIPLKSETARLQIEQQARSVACLVEKRHLVFEEDAYSLHPQVPTLADKLRQDATEEYRSENPGKEPPIFTYEGPFANELSLGEGTVFVVGEQLVLTAAHCVCSKTGELLRDKVSRLFVVFGYQKTSPECTRTTFSYRDVYKIDIVWRYKLGENDDWALLKLDREVENRPPMNLFSSQTTLSTQLYMLGYPSGLPLKFTMSGEIQGNAEAYFFETNLDAFAGNSGSPIFSMSTQKTVGMLLRGNKDYSVKHQGPKHKIIIPYNVRSGDIEETGYEKCHKITSVGFIKSVLNSSFKMAHTHFAGRKNYLNQLKALLAPSKQANVLLYGPGGVGKSELATHFANESIEAYAFIWHVSCGTEEEQYLGYAKLAQRLKVPLIEKESLQDLINRVHRQLEQSSEKPWLLILDNVEEPFLLPARGGSVLITSRVKLRISLIRSLEVLPMDPKEALELLTQITQKYDDECQTLLDKVGYYPLVLGQVAAFIRQEGISIENYLKEYDKYHGVPTLEVILRITIDKLPPKAVLWLYCFAYLNPALIPVSYLENWLEDSIEDVAPILDALEHHALWRPSEDRKSFSLHKELQKVLKDLAPPKTLQYPVFLLMKQSEAWNFEDTTDWTKTKKDAALWASHAELLIKAIQNSHLSDNLNQARILTRLADYQSVTGNYSKALTYFIQALEIRKKILGDHALTAASLSGVGIMLGKLGQHVEALKYKMEALELRKALLGPSHPDVASSLDNVGSALIYLGRYEEALKYQMEALNLRKTLLGPSHPDVESSLNNMSVTLGTLGRHEEALQYQMEALNLRKALLGPNHLDVAGSLNNLGVCYANIGGYAEALKYFLQTLEIAQNVFKENHPLVVKTRDNIKLCQQELNKKLNSKRQGHQKIDTNIKVRHHKI